MLDGDFSPMLVAGMAALAVAGVVFAIIFPYISGDRAKDKRVQNVSESRGRRLGAPASGAGDQASSRKKSVADSLKEIESRQKAKEKLTIRLRLERAGLEMTPRDFYIASIIAGVILFGAVKFGTSAPLMGAAVAGFVGAFGLPRWLLNKMIKRRQNKFLDGMANAIDVVVRGVKTGLPLNECLGIIARESPEPIASEFREVVEEQKLGVPLGEALERMSQRLPMPEVRLATSRAFCATVSGCSRKSKPSRLKQKRRPWFWLRCHPRSCSWSICRRQTI
jgi:tight adherence protein B